MVPAILLAEIAICRKPSILQDYNADVADFCEPLTLVPPGQISNVQV